MLACVASWLLGYSGWLLCSCWGVARLLMLCSGSLQTFPPLVITLFSKLIQFQCFDIIVFLSNVTLKLALKRDLYHLSSQYKKTIILIELHVFFNDTSSETCISC